MIKCWQMLEPVSHWTTGQPGHVMLSNRNPSERTTTTTIVVATDPFQSSHHSIHCTNICCQVCVPSYNIRQYHWFEICKFVFMNIISILATSNLMWHLIWDELSNFEQKLTPWKQHHSSEHMMPIRLENFNEAQIQIECLWCHPKECR